MWRASCVRRHPLGFLEIRGRVHVEEEARRVAEAPHFGVGDARCVGQRGDDARHAKIAASDRALDVGETRRRRTRRRTARAPPRLSGIAADAPSRTRRVRSESSSALTNGMSHATTSAMSAGGNRRDGGVKPDDAAALGPNVAVNGDSGEPLVGVRRVGDEHDLRRHGANRRRHPIDDANAADPSQSLRLAAEPLVRSAGDDGARHAAMRVSRTR